MATPNAKWWWQAAVQTIQSIESPNHISVAASHCCAVVRLWAGRVDVICLNPSVCTCHRFGRNPWDFSLFHPLANIICYREHEQGGSWLGTSPSFTHSGYAHPSWQDNIRQQSHEFRVLWLVHCRMPFTTLASCLPLFVVGMPNRGSKALDSLLREQPQDLFRIYSVPSTIQYLKFLGLWFLYWNITNLQNIFMY
jgi:hypothetical protein